MKKIIAIREIPNTLDVNELMGIKGGLTVAGNNLCIGGSAVKCDGSPAVAICQPGSAAVITTPPKEP